MKIFRSYSSGETANFGREFAREIKAANKKKKSNGATVLALQGDLGAGKTTFVQGFARGWGIAQRVASPTFVIMRRFKDFYHIDAYRIKKTDGLEVLGLKDIFADPAAIVVIEWPEKIKKILPRQTLWLNFRHGKIENERMISLSA